MSLFKKFYLICYSYSICLCLGIKNKVQFKVLRNMLFILLSPYLIMRCALCLLYEVVIGNTMVSKSIQKDNMKEFKYELAIVTIAKNEASYICEWIEYHKLVGVEKFYIYDNDSKDELEETLKRYIEAGIVVYKKFPGKNKQLPAYEDAINNYKLDCRWMAFIDCDEFLLPVKEKTLPELMHKLLKTRRNAVGVGVNWAMYGSSGIEKRNQGLVIERFLRRAKDDAWPNRHIKTICNPRYVKRYISPHFPIFKLGGVNINSRGKRLRLWYNRDVDLSTFRCNHYFCKSKEEFIKKRNRGMADRQNKYDFTQFDIYDLNDVYDNVMLSYIQKINDTLT